MRAWVFISSWDCCGVCYLGLGPRTTMYWWELGHRGGLASGLGGASRAWGFATVNKREGGRWRRWRVGRGAFG